MYSEEIIEAVSWVVKSGNLSSLHGKEVEKFESDFKNYIGSEYAVAVNSGTAALHTALLALGVGPGDEVICPAWTFVATASAVLMCGAKPVFADLEPGTFNIDPHDILYRITMKTRGIIAVHIGGIPCHMDIIKIIAIKNDLWVIEDSCQSLGSSYDGKKVGSIGDVGVFSFYPSKMVTTGEGGMIVTNNESVYKQSQLIRNHGQVGKNIVATLGFNYRMTEIQAAIGQVTLSHIDEEIKRRNINTFISCLKSGSYTIPTAPRKAQVAYSYLPVWFLENAYTNWYTPLYRFPMFEGKPLQYTEEAYRNGYVIPLI